MEPITFIIQSVEILDDFLHKPLRIRGTIENTSQNEITFCISNINGILMNGIISNPKKNQFPHTSKATLIPNENKTIHGGQIEDFIIYVKKYDLNSNMTLELKNQNGKIITRTLIDLPNLQNR